MNLLTRRKTREMLLLVAWPILASLTSFIFSLEMFYATLLFLGPPTLYLSFLKRHLVKRAALFSLSAAVPLVIIIDYIAHFTDQWLVLQIVFPRLLGFVSIEDVIWGFLFVYFVIMFYEQFVDSSRSRKIWHPRMKFFIGTVFILFAVFLTLHFIAPRLLQIPYFYFLWGVLILLLPSLIEFIRRPRLFPKFVVTAVYFFFFNFIYEITALKLGHWAFPGTQYIGSVSVFGVEFPFEEFLWGFVFYAIATLAFWEAFDDDEK